MTGQNPGRRAGRRTGTARYTDVVALASGGTDYNGHLSEAYYVLVFRLRHRRMIGAGWPGYVSANHCRREPRLALYHRRGARPLPA